MDGASTPTMKNEKTSSSVILKTKLLLVGKWKLPSSPSSNFRNFLWIIPL